jgi:SSS family solute:Na+ symporter
MPTAEEWIIISYVFAIFALLACASFAMYYAYTHRSVEVLQTEGFITARATQPWYRIAWSFYAGAVGCWAVVAPASYSVYAGYIGLIGYAISTGFPILIIAYAGEFILKGMPSAMSIADFVNWRFGSVAKTMVMLIVLFNMSITIISEYTTMGAVFSSYVGTQQSWPIIVVVASLTLMYTVYGGLKVSIVTDQVQAISSLILVLVICIYVAVVFRKPLPIPPPSEGCDVGGVPCLGATLVGWTTLFVYPVSLTAATLYSEVFWQRVWASENKKSLQRGAWMACAILIPVIFLFGFFGYLAMWSGLAGPETDPNILMFMIFNAQLSAEESTATTTINNAMGVVAIVMAVLMNESAVDSLQNGLTATFSSHFLKAESIVWTRLVVVLINIPYVIVAMLNYSVLELFLLGNMVSTCGMLPLALGIASWRNETAKKWITENSFVFGIVGGIIGVTGYGIGMNWDASDVSGSFSTGAHYAWIGNGYTWDYFMVALMAPVIAMLLWMSLAGLLYALTGWNGYLIGELMSSVPGWKYISGQYADEKLAKRNFELDKSPKVADELQTASIVRPADVTADVIHE